MGQIEGTLDYCRQLRRLRLAKLGDNMIELPAAHSPANYQNEQGWFYVLDDGSEVGPFESEWHMIKYVEDRDVTEEK